MTTLVERSVDYLSKSQRHTRYEDLTGRDSDLIRHKARQHKQARIKYPNRVLRWDKQKQDYVVDHELTREELEPSQSFLSQIIFVESLGLKQLNEISLRSVSVVTFSATLLQWGKRLEQHSNKQKSIASKMKQSDDPNVKLDGEARETEAEMFSDLGKMLVRVGGLAATGAWNIDRAYKYLVKQEKKRR